jgi:hypothetical protein
MDVDEAGVFELLKDRARLEWLFEK